MTGSALLRSARVLVVDDEPLIVTELIDFLTRRGFSVMGAPSAEQAERWLERPPGIDVALIDIRMPGEDGLSFIGRVLARWPGPERPRLIVMSGHATTDEAIEAVRDGVFALVREPWKLATLAETVERAARDRRIGMIGLTRSDGTLIANTGGQSSIRYMAERIKTDPERVTKC
jgi:two-component system, NarL family, response regulator PprB